MLHWLGYDVILANNITRAIEIYREKCNEINLIILDMIMSGISGSDAYGMLNEINHGVKLLLSTGYSINSQAQDILNKGYNGFIQKPFSINELSRKIREILDGLYMYWYGSFKFYFSYGGVSWKNWCSI